MGAKVLPGENSFLKAVGLVWKILYHSEKKWLVKNRSEF